MLNYKEHRQELLTLTIYFGILALGFSNHFHATRTKAVVLNNV